MQSCRRFCHWNANNKFFGIYRDWDFKKLRFCLNNFLTIKIIKNFDKFSNRFFSTLLFSLHDVKFWSGRHRKCRFSCPASCHSWQFARFFGLLVNLLKKEANKKILFSVSTSFPRHLCGLRHSSSRSLSLACSCVEISERNQKFYR